MQYEYIFFISKKESFSMRQKTRHLCTLGSDQASTLFWRRSRSSSSLGGGGWALQRWLLEGVVLESVFLENVFFESVFFWKRVSKMLFEKVSLGAATFEGEGGVFNGDFSTFFSFGKEVFFGVAVVALTGVWGVFAVSTFCCFVSAESLLAFPFADSLESLLFENGSFLTCVSSSMIGLVVPGFCFWSFEFKSGVFAQLGRPTSFMSFRES